MTIDLSVVLAFLLQEPYQVILQIIVAGGWTVFAWLLLYAGLVFARYYKRIKYTEEWKWVLLAIDIPQLNVQTPKAVEQFFSHIFSVVDPPMLATRYRRGFLQNSFSLEIVSIEGYIQFIIRSRDKFRDVVEAAIYAQYPDAEITEIEDYVNDIPTKYPNDTHDIWASDFILTEHYAHPIRLYRDFEHSISKDTILKDPMGTFLESFSRIGPGEQMWYQIIIEPILDAEWKKECIKEIKKLIGAKDKEGGSKILDMVSSLPLRLLEGIGDQIFGREGEASSSSGEKKRDEPPNQILYLTPGQKKLVEAMEEKISKIGFLTKIRAIYLAKKEVFNPARGVNSLVGAINQFNIPSSNSLLPKYITTANYFFAERRKNKRKRILVHAYKEREILIGKRPFVLNIEELATIWHFPMSHVKTPLVQKAEMKKTEPPSGLPMGDATLPGMRINENDGIKGERIKRPGYKTDAGDWVEGKDFDFG